MSASSSEVSDNDLAMEEASDDEPAPLPTPVPTDFTMEQAQMHFDVVMAEVQPVSAFRQARDEQCYKLVLLKHHRLTGGQIYGEFASAEAMAAEDLNFIEE